MKTIVNALRVQRIYVRTFPNGVNIVSAVAFKRGSFLVAVQFPNSS